MKRIRQAYSRYETFILTTLLIAWIAVGMFFFRK